MSPSDDSNKAGGYNVVYEYTSKAGEYCGGRYWTTYPSKEEFEQKSLPDILSIGRDKIIAAGVSAEEAVNIISRTSHAVLIRTAFADAKINNAPLVDGKEQLSVIALTTALTNRGIKTTPELLDGLGQTYHLIDNDDNQAFRRRIVLSINEGACQIGEILVAISLYLEEYCILEKVNQADEQVYSLKNPNAPSIETVFGKHNLDLWFNQGVYFYDGRYCPEGACMESCYAAKQLGACPLCNGQNSTDNCAPLLAEEF